MSCPPDPGLTATILAAALKLAWRADGRRDATGRELGALVDAEGRHWHLVLAAGPTRGSCVWALIDGDRPAMAWSMTRETFEALRAASASEEGVLLVDGAEKTLSAGFDGVATLGAPVCV